MSNEMEKVTVDLPWTKCPHCGKIVGIGVIRTGKVKDLILTENNEVECPRPECGKLIGTLSLIGVKKN